MLPKNRAPTHPGEMLLKEFMGPMELSREDLARHLRWSVAGLGELLEESRDITADEALDLGEAFGTGPEFWLNLQRDRDLWNSLRKHRSVPLLAQVRHQMA